MVNFIRMRVKSIRGDEAQLVLDHDLIFSGRNTLIKEIDIRSTKIRVEYQDFVLLMKNIRYLSYMFTYHIMITIFTSSSQ